MEVLLLTLGGLFTLVYVARNGSGVTAKTPALPSTGTGNSALANNGQQGLSNGAAAASTAAGTVGGIVATIGAGIAIGGSVDKSINPNSNAGTQAAASALGGLAAAGVVLLSMGWIAPPLFAVLLVVVAFAYTLVLLISDGAAQAYGQDGARADFQKQWHATHDSAFAKLKLSADPSTTDEEIERQLMPFIDGYMVDLNRRALAKWMVGGRASLIFSGIEPLLPDWLASIMSARQVESPSDDQLVWSYGFTRGKFVARYPSVKYTSPKDPRATDPNNLENGRGPFGDLTTPDFPSERLLPSFSATWCQDHVPPADWEYQDPTAAAAIAAMGTNAAVAPKAA